MALGRVVVATGAVGAPALAVLAIARAVHEHRPLVIALPVAAVLVAAGVAGVRWVLASHARGA
jgi:hypothetical protein